MIGSGGVLLASSGWRSRMLPDIQQFHRTAPTPKTGPPLSGTSARLSTVAAGSCGGTRKSDFQEGFPGLQCVSCISKEGERITKITLTSTDVWPFQENQLTRPLLSGPFRPPGSGALPGKRVSLSHTEEEDLPRCR